MLGAVDTEVFSRLLRELLNMDARAVIETVEEIVMQGRDLTQLSVDFTWYLRNLLLVGSAQGMEEVLDMSSENLLRLKEEAAMIDSDTLMHYIRVFSELSGQLKYASQKRVLLEVALIKLCRPQMEATQDVLLERLRFIEKQVEQLEKRTDQARQDPRVMYVKADEEMVKPSEPPILPEALSEDVKQVVKDFRNMIQDMSPLLKTYLKKARLSAGEGNRLQIVMPDEVSESVVKTKEHVQEIKQLIEDRLEKKIEIDIRHVEEGRRFEENFVDIENLINMEITVEE